MVHSHVGGVSSALVNQSITTVTTFGTVPVSRSILLRFGAIILSASDHEVAVGRVHRDAFELQCVQRGVIKICPGGANGSVSRSLPDPAVVSGKYG